MSLVPRPVMRTYSRGNTLKFIWLNYGALADINLRLDTFSDQANLAGVSRSSSQGSAGFRISRPLLVKESSSDNFFSVIKNWTGGFGQTFGDAIRATG